MKIRYHRQVRADVAAIREYGVQTWGRDRTLSFLAGFRDAFERLIETPSIGRTRDAIAPGLRSIRYQGYQVFYAISGDAVVVVAVLSERANAAALSLSDHLESF